MKFQSIILLYLHIILCCGYDNLSKDRTAAQSITWVCTFCTYYLPNNAVDGDISTCTRTERIGTDVQYPYKTVWWYVDLGDIKSVYSIRIQFKDYGQQYEIRQRGRMAGFSLYLSNTSNIEDGFLCYKDGPDLPPLDFNTTCITHGRYVIFYNERLPGVQYPADYELRSLTELCEVIVLGCLTPGRYGEDCDLICPSNCQEQRCHINNGTCLGCTKGWTGDFCNKTCSNGYYGMECRYECPGHCRDGIPCNHTSGECDNGCGGGWQGELCDQACGDGRYGPKCIYKCSGNCLNNRPCDKTTGKCHSCKPGYTGDLCSNKCVDGFYGPNCSHTCFSCIDDKCDLVTGVCVNGCDEGYTGQRCDEPCEYNMFGENCSTKCSKNCKNQSCDHRYGNCTHGCVIGWMGSNCSMECTYGRHGEGCLETCSGNCGDNTTCNRFNGNCPNGCKPPFTGEKCDKNSAMLVTAPRESSVNDAQYGYIAGLVVSIMFNILQCGILINARRQSMKKGEKTSSHYVSQDNQTTTTTDDTQTYQELHVSTNINSYQNLSFGNDL